jgi:hypothetical protein
MCETLVNNNAGDIIAKTITNIVSNLIITQKSVNKQDNIESHDIIQAKKVSNFSQKIRYRISDSISLSKLFFLTSILFVPKD